MAASPSLFSLPSLEPLESVLEETSTLDPLAVGLMSYQSQAWCPWGCICAQMRILGLGIYVKF